MTTEQERIESYTSSMYASSMYENEALLLYNKKIANMERKLEDMNQYLGIIVSKISDEKQLAEYVRLTDEYQREVENASVYRSGSTWVLQWRRKSIL